jgi:hypothetical protein
MNETQITQCCEQMLQEDAERFSTKMRESNSMCDDAISLRGKIYATLYKEQCPIPDSKMAYFEEIIKGSSKLFTEADSMRQSAMQSYFYATYMEPRQER